MSAISPASIHYNETMSTLRYARRATHIVNQPIINEVSRNISQFYGETVYEESVLLSKSFRFVQEVTLYECSMLVV